MSESTTVKIIFEIVQFSKMVKHFRPLLINTKVSHWFTDEYLTDENCPSIAVTSDYHLEALEGPDRLSLLRCICCFQTLNLNGVSRDRTFHLLSAISSRLDGSFMNVACLADVMPRPRDSLEHAASGFALTSTSQTVYHSFGKDFPSN